MTPVLLDRVTVDANTRGGVRVRLTLEHDPILAWVTLFVTPPGVLTGRVTWGRRGVGG